MTLGSCYCCDRVASYYFLSFPICGWHLTPAVVHGAEFKKASEVAQDGF